MPRSRDKNPAAPEGGPEGENPPPGKTSPSGGEPARAHPDLPPFPSPPPFTTASPEDAVPDFSIPPFGELPSFPSLSTAGPSSTSRDEQPPSSPAEEEEIAGSAPFAADRPPPEIDLPPLPPLFTKPEQSAPATSPPTASDYPGSESPPAFDSAEPEPAFTLTPEPAPGDRQTRRIFLRSVAALLILGIGLLGWIVKTPDVVTGRVTVTGLKSSTPVIPQRDGALAKLLVEEKQHVTQNQILALIENPAETNHVFQFAAELEKLRPFLDDDTAFIKLGLNTETDLGSLSDPYSAFHADYLHHRSTLADTYTDETVASLEKQLLRKREKIVLAREQAETSEREVELSSQKYERIKSLFERRTVSRAELEEQERAFLGQKRLSTGLAEKLVEENIALAGFEREIRDLRRQRAETLRDSRDSLRESMRRLTGALEAWENEYVLRAPEDGVIVFYDYWSEQRQVRKGKEAFLIIPESSPLIGRVRVDKERAGKIHDGQQVRIRLDGFPHREYGDVPGTVESISAVPLNDAYLISVKLEYPLITDEGRALTFKQDMVGEASIFTEEVRLIGRIMNEVRRALSQAAG